MKLDRKLNFTFPVDTDGGTVWVHSTPISRTAFETYWDVLGRVFTSCFDGTDAKHVALTAPQLALPALMAVAKEKGVWAGPGGVEFGFVAELARLTSVLFVGKGGWESLPYPVAVNRGILDEDTAPEVMSSLVFFTCISRVAPKALAATFLEMAGSLREWQFSSLGPTEFRNSLPISTQDASTTTAAPSAPPCPT